MRAWWKNPALIGNTAHLASRLLITTMRINVQKHESIDYSQPHLFAFWHGKQLLPAITLSKMVRTPKCVMASPSRDGAMLAVFLQKFGYEILRGSSRDNNVRALLAMKNKLQNGYSIGFGIDGPIGPMHVVKPGIVFLSQKCNIPIIPVGCAFNNNWVFHKAWDKFQVPKPFAKAAMVLAEPYTVSPETDIETACRELERRLFAAEEHARTFVIPAKHTKCARAGT